MSATLADENFSKIERLVRVVLLQDSKGMVQFVVPDDCLLDLNLLNSITERELVPVHQTEIVALTYAKKLKQLDFAAGFSSCRRYSTQRSPRTPTANIKSSTLMASKFSNCNSVLASSDDIKQIADNFKH